MASNINKSPASKGDIEKVILCLKDVAQNLVELEHKGLDLMTEGQSDFTQMLFGNIVGLEKEAKKEREVLSKRLDDIENKIDLLLRAKEQ